MRSKMIYIYYIVNIQQVMNYHPFETVKYPFTEKFIQIDTVLIPLMKQIWSDNIETIGCCQELIDGTVSRKKLGPGYSWIRFKTDIDFNNFVKFSKLSKYYKKGKNIYFKL